MANETANDVKTEVESSTPSAETTTGLEQSTQTQDDTAQGTLAEAIKATLDAKDESLVKDSEKEESDSKIETDKSKEQEEKVKPEDEKVDEKETAEGEKEEPPHEEAVPYERFKTVNSENIELKEKLERYEKNELAAYNNILNFCEQYNISAEQHQNAMRILALENSGKLREAADLLRQELQAIEGYVDGKLPQDLQEKVDAGSIDAESAKELAQLRKEKELQGKRSENSTRIQQERERQQLEVELGRQASQWTKTKETSDPDFFPKKKESDPDGKYEMVMDKYTSLLNQTKVENGKVVYVNSVKTPQNMLELLEKAYKAVDGTFARLSNRGKKPTKEPLTSTKSASTKQSGRIEEAGTMQEAIARGLKQSGHSVV